MTKVLQALSAGGAESPSEESAASSAAAPGSVRTSQSSGNTSFCCMFLQVADGDCDTCWSGARVGADTKCGASKASCTSCGGPLWCDGRQAAAEERSLAADSGAAIAAASSSAAIDI